MRVLAALIVGTALLTGCADLFKYRPYAREVKRKVGQGGIIALNTGHRQEDRDLADTLMKKVCGASEIQISEEGEVAVGTSTTGTTESEKGQKSYTKFAGMKFNTGTNDTTSSSSQTTELREWRINYDCVAAAGGNKKTARQ